MLFKSRSVHLLAFRRFFLYIFFVAHKVSNLKKKSICHAATTTTLFFDFSEKKANFVMELFKKININTRLLIRKRITQRTKRRNTLKP